MARVHRPTLPPLAKHWALTMVLSVAFGLFFNWANLPAAWILAGILGAGLVALTSHQELRLQPQVLNLCRGTIGILAGVPLLSSNLHNIRAYLLPGLFAALVTVGICLAGGWFLSRSQKAISAETGVLSMLAGGASIMPVLAQELKADYRYVALSQYLRLLVVSISLPLLAHSFGDPAAGAFRPSGEQPWWMVVSIFAIAIFGAPIGKLLHLPAPAVFGPMLLTISIGLALPDGYSMHPPVWMSTIAFLAIGWMCGGSLSVPALRQFQRLLPITLAFIAILIAGCAATAYPLHVWLDLDYFNAYLATSPGALETVIALASASAQLDAVVVVQLIRLIVILVLAGYLPQLLRWARRK